MTRLEDINGAILDNIDDYVLIIDRNYKILFANKAMLQFCGQIEEEDIIGQRCYEFSHQCPFPCYKQDTAIKCPHDRLFKTGKTASVTHTHKLPDGTELIFDITASPIRDEKGGIFQMIEVMRDVTEKMWIEKELKESEEKFKTLVEHSLVGVYLIQENLFRYVNPHLAKVFGYSQEELIDKKGPKDLVYEEDWHIVRENIRKRLEGEIESINYKFRGIKKTGKVFNVEVFGARTHYRGRPAVIGTLIDITRGQELEDELKKRIRELEEFYDMAINRELKMIELKEEIRRLKKELENYKR